MEAGIHDGIPLEEYINDPCPEPSLSTGVVGDVIERSAAHAHHNHPKLGAAPDDRNSRSDEGSAIHSLVLGGPKVFPVNANDWRKDATKDLRDAARAKGWIPILEKDMPRLEAIAGSAKAALDQFGAGQCEQTLIWQTDGVWHRNRPDFMRADRKLIVDLKTNENADPGRWISKCLMQGGYDVQAGLCLSGLDVLEGVAEREYLWLLVELAAPYLTSVVGLGEDMKVLALRKIAAARRVWRECLASKKWPGYDQRVHWAEPPAWAAWDFEARAIAYEGAAS